MAGTSMNMGSTRAQRERLSTGLSFRVWHRNRVKELTAPDRAARHSASSCFLARARASRSSGETCGGGRSISPMAWTTMHHVPRRPSGGGSRERFIVGGHVVIPVTAFGQVGRRKLPVLGRVVQAVEEPPFLLVARNVQEDLYDPGAVAVEVALEGVDVGIALSPHGLGRLFARDGRASGQKLGVHTDNEYRRQGLEQGCGLGTF
jgi:hypothetical protein